MESYVIDVQRCSIHDGPGIRTTVFLKGCPLKCSWCHNPESQSFQKQLSFNSDLCMNCKSCIDACAMGVHTLLSEEHKVDFSKCKQCGACVKRCPCKALTLIGKEMTPQEVFEIVIKDKVFYDEGEGGLTISGGEALSHVEFCVELLTLCNKEGIHTCIETSGYASLENIKRITPLVDLFLFDYKVSDDEAAKKYVGKSLEIINKNFEVIYNQGEAIILRCPIISGVNDTIKHFKAIEDRIKAYPDLLGVELLPYHHFGVSKGNNIGRRTEQFSLPSEEDKNEWLGYFKQRGYGKVILR